MEYSDWFGPFTTPVAALADQMWATLLLTTITGKQYKQKGQPDSGSWGAAKALRDQIKEAG